MDRRDFTKVMGGVVAGLGDLRAGASVVSRVSQLALGVTGSDPRLVLRARAESGRQHPRGCGDARISSHNLAGILPLKRALHCTILNLWQNLAFSDSD